MNNLLTDDAYVILFLSSYILCHVYFYRMTTSDSRFLYCLSFCRFMYATQKKVDEMILGRVQYKLESKKCVASFQIQPNFYCHKCALLHSTQRW